ncbi:hypothetical protein PoB_002072400 [Plakobranchus ocellatus]|uniref:Uncharacterized protein n=1 Tax=Plakobranchus ocellatus TaxID=259542 RepID=A0AAV3ZIJ7_9GAST|nr:hypothetical protein PoB_002072400 [Plakobranchus ocellatus]
MQAHYPLSHRRKRTRECSENEDERVTTTKNGKGDRLKLEKESEENDTDEKDRTWNRTRLFGLTAPGRALMAVLNRDAVSADGWDSLLTSAHLRSFVAF